MRKIPLAEYAFANPRPGINAKNTISNGPDDGTNNLLASHFWNPMRHGSTQQAVSNGLAALVAAALDSSTGELNIGGHGNEGLLETGMGQNGPFSNETLIATWNESSWGPQLDKLKTSSVTQVSIWSCHTGAGQAGADLLFAMAKRCGRAVRAGTGFLYSNTKETWWENGSVWQVATPTNKPAPIAAPSAHAIVNANLVFDVAGQALDATAVQQVDIELVQFGRSLAAPKSLRKRDAQQVVGAIFRGPALEMDAHIAGFKTARIRVDFGSAGSMEFDVYNDRLAVDARSKCAYYMAHSLQALFASLP